MRYRPCLQRLTTPDLAYSHSQHRKKSLLQNGALALSIPDGIRRAQTQASPEARQPEKPKQDLPRSQESQLHRRSGGVAGASLPKPTLRTLLLSTPPALSPLQALLSSRLQSQFQTSLPGQVYSTMATPSDPQAAPPADTTETTETTAPSKENGITQEENGATYENGAQENSSDEEFSMPLSKFCHLFSSLILQISMSPTQSHHLSTAHLHLWLSNYFFPTLVYNNLLS